MQLVHHLGDIAEHILINILTAKVLLHECIVYLQAVSLFRNDSRAFFKGLGHKRRIVWTTLKFSRHYKTRPMMQENLFNLMARLGTDHPFHAMYPLLSLSNGNRMDDGTIASTDNVLALQQGMDANKIRGANRVIDRIASKPHR